MDFNLKLHKQKIIKYFNFITLFYVNLFLLSFIFSLFIWNIISFAKTIFLSYYQINFNIWTYSLTDLSGAALLKYISVAFFYFLFSLFFYFNLDKVNSFCFNKEVNKNHYIFSVFNFFLIIYSFIDISNIILVSLILFISGLIFIHLFIFKINIRGINLYQVLIISIFSILIYECFQISFTTPNLLNEFPQIDEYTNVSNNKKSPLYVSNFNFLKNNNLEKIKEYNQSKYLFYFDKKKLIDSLFYQRNWLEYYHQNMNRSVWDHISYILCPVLEFSIGKNIKEIVFQYGFGVTLVYKEIMELFGGISIHNYYKGYLFYIFYFIMFYIFLKSVFKYKEYILISLSWLFVSFTYNGYVPFILAPGLNPIIHFIDIPILFLSYFVFKHNKPILFIPLFFLSIISMFLNLNYGLFITLSFLTSFLLYIYENNKKTWLWIFVIFSILVLSFFIWFNILFSGKSYIKYMLIGFLSFAPSRRFIVLTIIYLFVNYFVLIKYKEKRNYIRYLFFMVFVYSQFLLIYFYWSGLTNHLTLPLPFLFLDILLMFFYLKDSCIVENSFKFKILNFSEKGLFFITLLVLFLSTKSFYVSKDFGKLDFLNTFKYKKVFNWNTEMAKIKTTISYQDIEGNIKLINKYSKDNYICIISKYDSFLTFLLKKYSIMPTFSLGSFLFTDKEVEESIKIILNHSPEYLFVDNDFINQDFNDPYDVIYNTQDFLIGRTARFEKYKLLSSIFDKVKDRYEFLESSNLISVYKLKIPDQKTTPNTKKL